ncbi:Lipase 4 [Grifola frondosa]|uniref:Lipase 4 n=1 Tax=Grifola frondosa TaxID=5627 RepID=A0A1C7LS34_GRIFR|nr:Lipase 4 [Grifola frondosa]
MLTNGSDSEGLFRAGFMESGSTLPTGNISKTQGTYDFVVSEMGCSSSPDTSACLRAAPVESIKYAMDKTSNFSLISLSTYLVIQGRIADVPSITGNVEDEGTLFSLSTFNITTDTELKEYISSNYFRNTSNSHLDRLLELYPADPTLGSPYGTGHNCTFTLEYKRLASFHGDWLFQAPRRFFLEQRASKQSAWSYISKREQIPGLGAVSH